MADIDIVPKRRSYLWLWIVLALVILAVLWYALAGGGNEGRTTNPVGALGEPAPVVAAVSPGNILVG